MKMPTFFIQPFNEGQELNYSETYRGTVVGAKMRAAEMRAQLIVAMPQGIITVDVQDESGRAIAFSPLISTKRKMFEVKRHKR